MSFPSLLLGFLLGFFAINYVIQKSKREELAARDARRQKSGMEPLSEGHESKK